MPGSFIDMLPPEAQSLLGGIALLVALAGLILWAAGVKIARFSVAILLGAALAALGAWFLPKIIGIAGITGGLVGFVVGALTGALGFRILQGVTLAICLGLAVSGTYYRWHVLPELAAPTSTAQTAPIDSQLIRLDALPPGPDTSPAALTSTRESEASPFTKLLQSLADHWNAIPATHQHRLLIVGIGTAAIALLIAFGFPRRTTWFTTALLGALLLLAGVNALIHVYGPQYEAQLPSTALFRYLLLAIVTCVGMVIQRRFFWPPVMGRGPVAAPAPPASVTPPPAG